MSAVFAGIYCGCDLLRCAAEYGGGDFITYFVKKSDKMTILRDYTTRFMVKKMVKYQKIQSVLYIIWIFLN